MNSGNLFVEVHEATRASTNSAVSNEPYRSRRMKLMTWAKIRRTLFMASARGNKKIIRVFWQVLQKEALFDDQGAWYRE